MVEVIEPMRDVATKEEVARRVAEKVAGRHLGGVTLEVVSEDIVRMSEGERAWWRVPVRPSAWPEPLFPYYEALAEVEGELQEDERLNILIATGAPAEGDAGEAS